MVGKNLHLGPVGDQIPAGDGDGEEFFPRNREWGGDGGGGVSRDGDGDGDYAPPPRPIPLVSLPTYQNAFPITT